MLTVFTPTYNRGYIIDNLYKSLQRQTCKNFEWLVIDDGSTDDTSSLFASWQEEQGFCVRYIRQENGGKHRAINRGAKEARGELFFIVDSDDYLADNAVERIIEHYDDIKAKDDFAGVCGLKCYPDGERVGGDCNFGVLDCNSLELRYKYKVVGDMAEILCTDILRQYPFPEIEGELFCPEAVLFNRIAQKYKLRYFYENVYVCDYLSDGLTAKITRIRMQSPVSAMICYSELAHCKIPLVQKIKATINYWRFSFCSHTSFFDRIRTIGICWLLLLPIGYVFHLIDKSRCKL